MFRLKHQKYWGHDGGSTLPEVPISIKNSSPLRGDLIVTGSDAARGEVSTPENEKVRTMGKPAPTGTLLKQFCELKRWDSVRRQAIRLAVCPEVPALPK